MRTKYLGKYLAQKRDEQTGEWRKLHNVEVHNLYSNADIIQMLKPRRLRRAGHVSWMGDRRRTRKILLGKQRRRAYVMGV